MHKLTRFAALLGLTAGILGAATAASATDASVQTSSVDGIVIKFIGYGSSGDAMCIGPLGPGTCSDIVAWLQRAGAHSEPVPTESTPPSPDCDSGFGFFQLCTAIPMPKESFSCLAPNSPEASAYCSELSRRTGVVF